MKLIIVILFCLFFSAVGYSQKGKLFIKDISDGSLKRSQLNDKLEFATDIQIDTTITLTIMWLDSTINKGRVIELQINKDNKFIPDNILEAWKNIPSKSKVLLTKAKYFDKSRKKFIKLDTDMYEVTD